MGKTFNYCGALRCIWESYQRLYPKLIMTTNKKLGFGGCAIRFFAGIGFLISVPIFLVIWSILWHQFGNTETHSQFVGAMEPTIHGGGPDKDASDKFVVDKWAYRSNSPERFDIVYFTPTEALLKESFTKPFLQRIVALPGENVEIKNQRFYVNGQVLTEDSINVKGSTVIEVCQSSPTPAYLKQPQTIPPDSYLTMGDSRMNSYDGRCWGTVPRKNIIGKVTKIIKN